MPAVNTSNSPATRAASGAIIATISVRKRARNKERVAGAILRAASATGYVVRGRLLGGAKEDEEGAEAYEGRLREEDKGG